MCRPRSTRSVGPAPLAALALVGWVFTFSASGEGAELVVVPSALHFGSQPVGAGATSPLTFEISNGGDAALTVYAVALTDSTHFGLTGWPGTTVLTPGEPPIVVSVVFDPAGPGSFEATAVVSSDASVPEGGVAAVALTGRGTERLLSLSPGSIAFGQVVVGQSGTAPLVVRNAGEADLVVTGVSFSGPDAAQFLQSSGPSPPFIVQGESEVTLTLGCSPTSIGGKSASFSVAGDADNTSSETVGLSCAGVEPDVIVDPAAPIAFADTPVGKASEVASFSISNASGAWVSALTAVVANSNPADFTVQVEGCTLDAPCIFIPGQSRRVDVHFVPGSVGEKAGTVTVLSDDPDESSLAVALSGLGLEPETCDVEALAYENLAVLRTVNACRVLEVGPQVTIESTGDVNFQAGERVVLYGGFRVEAGGSLSVATCGHSLCEEGPRLPSACHACVEVICSTSPECCETQWGATCVTQVGASCGLTCPSPTE